ncbi:MAG: hypothetical protein AAB446_00050, partial [Patescibacteria group bacterium]
MLVNKSLYLKGKKYISASRAAEVTGYASDYIGQLCRGKKVTATLVGRSWYVLESEILNHKEKNLISHKKTLKTRKLKKGGLMMKLKELDRKENLEIKEIEKDEKKTTQISIDPVPKKTYSSPLQRKFFGARPTVSNISSIRDVRGIKPFYYKDNRELFPVLKKNIKIEEAKINTPIVSPFITPTFVSKISSESAKKSIRFSTFKRLPKIAVVASLVLISVFTFAFGRGIISKTNNNSQLASSVFSSNTLQSFSGWVKDTTYKIIKPWLFDNKTVLVDAQKNPIQVINNVTNYPQAKTVVVAGSDKEYVDVQIAELKKYFLTLPFTSSITPNLKNYYITRQNDRIVDLIGRSSGGSGSSGGGGGTSNVANLSDLTDVTISSIAYGDVLLFNGSQWVNTATSTLGITTGLDTAAINAFIDASTTIAKLYTDNVWAGTNSVAVDRLNITGAVDGCAEFSGGYLTSVGISCGTSGGGITSLNGLAGSSQTFATSSINGLTLTITSSGSIHTFTPGLASGYIIPLSASTTEWNTFYTTPSNRITAGLNLAWNSNTLNLSTTTLNLTTSSFASNDISQWNNNSGYLTSATGLTSYDAFTHNWNGQSATSTSMAIGTSTSNFYTLTVASSTAPQFSLSAGAGIAQWTMRNAGGNLYFATTTVAGTATTSTSALSINGSTGAISIATTTAGCLNTNANGLIYSATCGAAFVNTLANGGTATTTFYNGGIIFASSTGSGLLSQSSSASNFFWDETNKRLGLGTSNPLAKLSITGDTTYQDLFRISSSTDNSMFNISWYGGLTQNISSTTAVNIQDGSGNSVFTIDTTQAGTDAGINITAGNSQTGNLLNFYASDGTTILSTFNRYGWLGVGTSTPQYLLTAASSTAPQLSLSAGAGLGQVTFRNDGTNFYISTTTIAGTATTSISALEIALGGFGTTTVRGLNISGQATTTSNVGINLSAGCFAIGGTCVGGSSGLTSYDAFTHNWNGQSATSTSMAIGTSTSNFYTLTVASSTAPQLSLSAGVGIAQWTMRNAGGNLYFATTTVDGLSTTTTSALAINGATGGITISSLAGASTRCLNISSAGLIGAAASDCGTGGGVSGGSWATSTAFGTTYVNYSLNTTDVIAIGATGASATSTAKFWFDPNSSQSYLGGLTTMVNASSTLSSSTYASSTNAFFGTLSLNGTDLQTSLNSKQATISTTWPITLSGATIGFNGLSTSSALTSGQITYAT